MSATSSAWPIPRPSWRALVYNLTRFTDTSVPYGDGTLELSYNRNTAASPARRRRRLRAGKEVERAVTAVATTPSGRPRRTGPGRRVGVPTAATGVDVVTATARILTRGRETTADGYGVSPSRFRRHRVTRR